MKATYLIALTGKAPQVVRDERSEIEALFTEIRQNDVSVDDSFLYSDYSGLTITAEEMAELVRECY